LFVFFVFAVGGFQGLPFLVDGFDFGLCDFTPVDGGIAEFFQVGLDAEGVEGQGRCVLADVVDVEVVLATGTFALEVILLEGFMPLGSGEGIVCRLVSPE
jgi:hypothetical protein